MSSSLEERDEVIVVNDSIELMRELRKELGKKFPQTWVMVHCDYAQKRYGIEVAGVWGGRLEDGKLEPIQDFIEKFMIERKVDFVEDSD